MIVPVTANETADQIAQSVANFINKSTLNSDYTATIGTETDKGDSASYTYTTVTITPIADNGADFIKGTISIPDGKTGPANVVVIPKVVNSGPGDSKMQLLPYLPPNPSLQSDWRLAVVNQTDQVPATSTLLDVSDTISATSLIAMFSSDLSSQGIPVFAIGDTLSLSTENNDFFVLSQSASGGLYPLFSDAAIPEPSTLTLFGIAAVVFVICSQTRRRQASGTNAVA